MASASNLLLLTFTLLYLSLSKSLKNIGGDPKGKLKLALVNKDVCWENLP